MEVWKVGSMAEARGAELAGSLLLFWDQRSALPETHLAAGASRGGSRGSRWSRWSLCNAAPCARGSGSVKANAVSAGEAQACAVLNQTVRSTLRPVTVACLQRSLIECPPRPGERGICEGSTWPVSYWRPRWGGCVQLSQPAAAISLEPLCPLPSPSTA